MARLDWYIRANLKMRHLQLLVALDDYRHLGKVAALMHVTQPAISKTLAELQTGLGSKLFERTGRGLRPTDVGAALIRHARKMLQDLSEAGDELHAISTGISRRIRIGTLPASAGWLLPEAIVRLKQREPNAAVFVREATMDLLMNEMRLGNIDVIVGTLPARRGSQPEFDELPLFDDDTVLVARRGHPLAQLETVSWLDVAPYPWVMPPTDSLLRQPLLVAFNAHGIEPPQNYIETLSLNVSLHYVRSTDALAAMPGSAADRFANAGMLARLPLRLTRLMRSVGAMWPRGNASSPALVLMLECLSEAAEGSDPKKAVTVLDGADCPGGR
ncbi:LysR substrate-binding domain-containing protein [uncultured Hydrogenophaga sp.]|uniref:LysR family transcriptional regulator n=1 Tax=uncultured Hydrogenophaga sp. TaxID=199683 RepID=UPI00258F7069|nr:LysR substrate-binding domain-containing protein [uncultured Hydrogenophaga sp.]